MSREEIDRAFYEAIRKELIDRGYWPQYNANAAAMKIAVSALGKNAIEPVGYGTGENRGLKKANQIFVDRIGEAPGTLGGGSTRMVQYQENGETFFRKERLPASTRILTYEITLVAMTTKAERIMSEVIEHALEEYPLYLVDADGNTTAEYVIPRLTVVADVTSTTDLLEKKRRYNVNAWVGKIRVLDAKISPVKHVTFEFPDVDQSIEKQVITE